MLRFSLFLTMVAVMTTNISAAEEVNQCSADMLPIQILDWEFSGIDIRSSATELSESHLRTIVIAVTEHIAARLSEEKLCLDSPASKERSLLKFVRWRLIRDVPPALDQLPRDARSSDGGCRLFSPWIDLIFERKPVPSIRGIVRWNERQLLADQAVLAGAKNVPPGVAMPLTRSDFGHFVNEYEEWEPFFSLSECRFSRRHWPRQIPLALTSRWRSRRRLKSAYHRICCGCFSVLEAGAALS